MGNRFYKANFIFKANRYEEWQSGQCLSQGVISTEIVAEVYGNTIHFELDDIGRIRMLKSFDFDISDEDGGILPDRIQYVRGTSDFNPIVPVICHIFYSGSTMQYVRFAMTNPDRIVEFYGKLVELSKPQEKDAVGKDNLGVKLASQFMVESMTSHFDYSPNQELSDIPGAAHYQSQYARYCLMAKSNIASASIATNMANPLMVRMMHYVNDYIADENNRTNAAMKYLYELDYDDLLFTQISMLTFHACAKQINDVHNMGDADDKVFYDLESVCLVMGLYTYFTIRVNENYSDKDFNKLFVESWFCFFENLLGRIMLIKIQGNDWKNDFKGVLFS